MSGVGAGILPTYQRYSTSGSLTVLPLISRRTLRSTEKFLIVLVCFTLVVVCLGTFFFLPEFRSSNNIEVSVFKVYQQIQKAGPELLIPVPPQMVDGDALKLIRHDDDTFQEDPHILVDREKFHAKLLEDDVKVLERPNVGDESNKKSIPAPALIVKSKTSESKSTVIVQDSLKMDGGEINDLPRSQQKAPDEAEVVDAEVPPKYYLDGEDTNPQMQKRREKVKEMMKHAWDSYVKYAWGHNELRPVSKRGHTSSLFGTQPFGATILDGLDSLYIMGLMDEFKQGHDWLANNFAINNITGEISVFEVNIRFVGGLISCYALTGDPLFRDRAQEIADKLLPAFDTPTGIPYALVNFKSGRAKNYGWASAGASILSEFGTIYLEFSYLSDITGNPIYRNKVEKIYKHLQQIDKPDGLYPNYLNPKTGQWGQKHMSMGALGDSFYEYLLKAWIQSNYENDEIKQMFIDAMEAMLDKMLQRSPKGLMYFAELKYGKLEHKMDHLGCFSGGLLGLASTTLNDQGHSTRYMNVAQEITHTCHESYDRADVKLGPEAFRFSEGVEARGMKNNEKYYILRPEVIESYFVMWRLTKDPKYREWAWEAVQALEKYCRTDGGYTGLKNVYLKESVKDDVQQSFFLAETLKYLYLIFSDEKLLPFEEWVFNTEAHPLPIKDVNPYYRAKQKDDVNK